MTGRHAGFFASLFLSRLADHTLLFLVPLVVFQMTGSVAWSGAAFFFETLPRFLAFPICGILCDRVSPLRLMGSSQLWRAVVCVVALAGFMAVSGVGWLIGLAAICGVLTTQGLMAREVMLPQVFRDQRFEKVAANTQIADQLGTVLGPILAAALLGLWAWEYVVAVTALLFLAADGAFILWKRMEGPELAPPQASDGWAAPLATAARHIIRLPGLGEVVALSFAVNLVIGVTLATSAAMVTGVHERGEAYYAGLQAAGAVATVLILAFLARSSMPTLLMGGLSFVLIVTGGLVSGFAPGAHVYAAGFILIVGFDKMFNVFIRTLRQRIIPRQDLGKTTGLIVMLNNLSQPMAGLCVTAFAALGASWIIVALTAAAAIIGGGAAKMLRRRAPITG